jgi:hypothetical protein
MRSLSGLKARIADLLAARRELAARPRMLCFLPRNGREPADAPDGTFTTGTPFASVVHYQVDAPPPELVAAREQDAREAQVVPRTETTNKGNRP